MADLGDIIELTVDLPERHLRAGTRGAVVHRHSADAFEVEITDTTGEELDLLALQTDQFIVVWRADTQQTVPVWERASALLRALPEDSAREVLDFARFLSVRRAPEATSSP